VASLVVLVATDACPQQGEQALIAWDADVLALVAKQEQPCLLSLIE
jgi:hypothetical protein